MLRRIVSVFGVVALMVALLVAMAAPAMAQYQNCSTEGTMETCSGGGGGGGQDGGVGGYGTLDRESSYLVVSGSQGSGGGGGGFGFGSHCEGDAFGGLECSGKGFGGNE